MAEARLERERGCRRCRISGKGNGENRPREQPRGRKPAPQPGFLKDLVSQRLVLRPLDFENPKPWELGAEPWRPESSFPTAERGEALRWTGSVEQPGERLRGVDDNGSGSETSGARRGRLRYGADVAAAETNATGDQQQKRDPQKCPLLPAWEQRRLVRVRQTQRLET